MWRFLRNNFCALLLVGMVMSLPAIISISLDREQVRREVAFEYRCAAYGDAINKHYGRDVCAPTPRG